MSKKSGPGNTERRKAGRRPVLETFSFFAVVPKKGDHRLPIHDVSEGGMGFDLDTEGETSGEFPLQTGETLEVRFYLNQSLFIPLTVRAVRIDEIGDIRKIGSEFTDQSSRGYLALAAFLKLLDSILDAVRIDPAPRR